jgi:adenosylcobinamide-GDP ribazoletransferase
VNPTADGLRLAVGTLTAVRVRPPGRVDRPTARVAMVLAPVAVLPLGGLAAAVGGLGALAGLGPLVVAALTIGAVALGSRGLHLDGLADTADGLGSGYDRTRALEIMRRGNVGPMGVTTLVVVLVAQIAAMLARPGGFVLVGVLVCLSRSALLLACARGVPPARPDGLGAMVAGVVPRAGTVAGLLVTAGIAAAVVPIAGSAWWWGPLAVLVAGLAVAGLLTRCVRRFGGITGDVMGATIEIALLALLVVLSR